MRQRFRKLYLIPVLALLTGLLGTCGKSEDELKKMLEDYLVFDTVMINLALSNVPELFAYDRLFTAPSHATAGANIDIAVGACGGTFQAGASRSTIAGSGGSGTLGSLVGDIPLAGFNRASILAGSVLHEKQNPGVSPHHHFFKRSDGTLDSIDARAVVINCNGTKYAIVIVDTVIMSQDVYDTVFADTNVNTIVGNSRARMILAATHTHSGPGAFATKPLWKLISGDIFVPAAYAGVTSAIISAIKNADAALVNAKMGVITQTGPSVQKNRRSEYYSSGSAPLDSNMIVAQIQRTSDSQPIATIVNFAVHPITLEPSNTLLSSDILGDAMRKYEAATTGTSSDVCIFLNGAEGDVSPSSTLPSPLSLDDIGTKLKDSIATAVGSLAFQTTVSIGAAFQPTTLPTPVVTYAPFTSNAALLNMSLGQTVETIGYFNSLYINLNNAQALTVTTVPGEPITEVGTSIKSAASTQMTTACGGCTNSTMVSGLSNGYMGYIVTSAQYDKGGYEAAGTMYGRTTDTTVINAATAAVTAARN